MVDASIDWRGRSCKPNKHGGNRAAVFVLGLQAMEIMAIAAVGNNLITYVFEEMHFPLPKSANVVTNFIGTVFLLSLLGGFLSDSYFGSFTTILIFGTVELSGFILLSVQAHLPQLRPPKCQMTSSPADGGGCEEAGGLKAAVFFLAIYLVALGSGCLKPNMISHGADQYSEDVGGGRLRRQKQLSTYFNAAYFSFCAGELVALTAFVWLQTHSGMGVGFGASAAAMAAGIVSFVSGSPFYRNNPPTGSIFTPIAQVFVAAFTKRKQICPSSAGSETIFGSSAAGFTPAGAPPSPAQLHTTNKFRFLDKACIRVVQGGGGGPQESPWRLCSPTQVEQVKVILSVIPIFACTIVFNTILAQLQTFSVQQGSSMDTRLADGFTVPPASLQAIPYLVLIFAIPLYELLFVPAARRLTGTESGITPLQRIGVGLFAASFSMVAAALVEGRRRRLALRTGGRLPILWVAPQYLIFGLSEMFTAVGLVEFFYKQSMAGMQSFFTAMTYCSYSFGFFLSSLLVSLVNKITTSSSGGGGWLSDNDLNKDQLDYFYWLLAALSLLNFFNYIFWSWWYSSSSAGLPPAAGNPPPLIDGGGDEAAKLGSGEENRRSSVAV